MRKLFLPAMLCMALLLPALLTACGGKSNLDKLDGKWVADVEASMKSAGMDGTDQMQMNMARQIFGSITMEADIKASKMTLRMGPNANTTSFTVESDSGDRLELKSTNGQIMTFTFQGDDTVVLSDKTSPDKTFVMKRAG